MNMRTQEDYWDWFKTTLTDHSVNLKAIEKSIISKKEFEEMLEHEKINLIFKEGLSSNVEANDI